MSYKIQSTTQVLDVERIFSYQESFRRQTIDYEFRADKTEAMVQLACCKLMLDK